MRIGYACAAVMYASAVPALGQTPPPPPPADAMTQAAPYVMAAETNDLYEIESSKIALQKTQNAKVRKFASGLIKDHNKITAETMKAAEKAGLSPPSPTLNAGITASLDELRNASAADFDRLYVGQQILAHRVAFGLHSHYSNAGDQSALRRSARKAIAPIERDLNEANKLNAQISSG